MRLSKFFALFIFTSFIFAQKIIIPMDQSQNNHLKAYGVVYKILDKELKEHIHSIQILIS